MDSVQDRFLSRLLNPTSLSGGLIYALLFLGMAIIVARLIRVFAARSKEHLPDVTAINFIAQLLQVIVFLVAFILYAQLVPILRSLGTALLAGVSVASIVIGIAAQSTLANLIAGLSLLLYRPFQVGDRVQLATPKGLMSGTIESLSLGYTSLQSPDGEQIIVPNSVMSSAVIILLPAKK
jgi:moderate conductance mechanosensitive channel